MTINSTVKIDRKALVKELAAEIGGEVKYLGAPTMAYQVGPYTINRDASIAGDDLEAIRDFLIRHDYIHRESAEPQREEIEGSSEEQSADQEAESVSIDSQIEGASADPTEEITSVNVSIPISELTSLSLTNLLKLLYAKQKLIAAMIQSDDIFIDEEVVDLLNDEKPDNVDKILKMILSEANVNMIRGLDLKEDQLAFTFLFNSADSSHWASVAKLLTALMNRAKAAQHISAKRIDPAESEMKYYCNSMLNQLGFGGADFKADRAALLGHLTGYAAFKSADKMEAHKAKYSELRKAARLAENTAASEDADVDLKADGAEDSIDSGEEVL